MVILGIDPGSRVTGFGVIKISGDKVTHISHGIILLEDQDSFSGRMCELGEGLEILLKKYQPEHVAIEKIFLGKNADSAFKLGHARGVAMYESAKNGAHIFEYATRIVKKGIVGNGAAIKEQVQMALLRLLNIKAISKIDASDALALAVFHAFQITNPLHSIHRPREARDL
jgi:crossover junction endodeoxyribonuclease RuvC